MAYHYRVTTKDNVSLAGCDHLKAAAILVGCYGEGTKIVLVYPKRIVWHEGREDFPINADSVKACEVVLARENEIHRQRREKYKRLDALQEQQREARKRQ
jgi:hypothetical protein